MNKKTKNMQILMQELQGSLRCLSDEHLPLEESIKEYAKAADLIEQCYHCLEKAKLQVQDIDERLAALEEDDGV